MMEIKEVFGNTPDLIALQSSGAPQQEAGVFLFYLNAAAVGWVQVEEREGSGKISSFELLPKARGRGLARPMLSLFLGRLKEKGMREVVVEKSLTPDLLWNGLQRVFAEGGFKAQDKDRLILALRF